MTRRLVVAFLVIGLLAQTMVVPGRVARTVGRAHTAMAAVPRALLTSAGQPPALGAAQLDDAADPLSPISCTGGEEVLLIQDNVPWTAASGDDPLGSDVTELKARGLSFCIITSSQLDTTPLSSFRVVLIASAQGQPFYDNLFPGGMVDPVVSAYVQGGGILGANLADYASGPGADAHWSGSFVGGPA